MNAATVPKQRVGRSREEMVNCTTIQEKILSETVLQY
jgi:hypothetical protein